MTTCVLVGMLMVAPKPALAQKAIRFKDLQKTAQTLAAKPYEPPAENMPGALKDMGYDQWRDLRFKKSLWADENILLNRPTKT